MMLLRLKKLLSCEENMSVNNPIEFGGGKHEENT